MVESKRAARAGGGYHTEIRRWRKESPLQWKIALLKNISSGGILFSSHEDLAVDEIIEFKIILPSADDAIHCRGMVKRVPGGPPVPEGSIGAPLFEVAAEFTEIEVSMKAALERFAEEHRILLERAERARGGFAVSVRNGHPSSDWDIVTLRDVSSSGLIFNCNEPDPPRGNIDLILHFLPEERFCQGEVVRIEENSPKGLNVGDNIHGVAVRFNDLNNDTKGMIDLFVNRFMKS
ncbi:MAG: PilZ domain-containing protein [Desulfobacteraceae bacterium]|nr:PilZ domain-containing protein [Desulfobacteraceae bacterium]